jgi:predicted phosphodiesterase
MNYAQDVVVEVPEGAIDAVFSWEFTADAGARYWAIDSVAVHEVQRATDVTPTQAWVMSDIQGHPADFQHALGDYSEIAPEADGMLLVGDIVNSGTAAEWQEIYDVMDATADIRPRQTVAANGNHERYAAGGYDANLARFFAFAERDKPWGEYIIEGPAGDLPVLVLGQEFASPSDVAMSDAQVEFLEERLAHWTELDTQVLVMTHFPLGDTVSASWIPGYHGHHQMNDRLTSILGNYPNAIVFTGHTHYPAELGDWAVQRRTDDGHADGFWAINTIAMHVEWDAFGENTDGIEEKTTRDINQGLTVDAYGDRVVVTAYDFAMDEQLRRVEIPNPLVEFDAEVRPVTPDPEEPVDPEPVDPEPVDPAPPVNPEEPGGDQPSTALPGDASGDGSPSGGGLAATGAEVPWAIGVAAAALVAGGLGLALRARRKI